MSEAVRGRQSGQPSPEYSTSAVSVQWVGVILFLIMLGISKYDPTSFLERGTKVIDAFSWFWRFKFAGALTFIDLSLGTLLAMTIVQAIRRGTVGRSTLDLPMLALVSLVAAGALLGRLNPGPQDTATDILFQLRNYAYLAVAYFTTSRLRITEQRYRQLAGVMIALTLAVVLLGLWETSHIEELYRLSKYGRLETARDATDNIFLIYAQLLLLAIYCEDVVRRRALRVVLLGGVLYSLYSVFTSVSKTLIALYPLALLYLAWHHGYHRRRWFVPAVIAVVFVGACTALVVTNVAAFARDPASALFVYSTVGSADDFSTATRLNQVLNTLPNLLSRGGLVQGLGPGSRWYEFIPQFPVDEAAYPVTDAGTGWHLGIHVPLLRLLLDFGLVGFGLLLAIVWRMLRNLNGGLRRYSFEPITRACVRPIIMLLVFQVTVNNLSVPKTNLIVGILLGVTSSLFAGASCAALHGRAGDATISSDGTHGTASGQA